MDEKNSTEQYLDYINSHIRCFLQNKNVAKINEKCSTKNEKALRDYLTPAALPLGFLACSTVSKNL